MAMRNSKYRNTTSNIYKTEFQYTNLTLSNTSGDGAVVAGNMLWVAMAWHSNTGGAIGILPADATGRRNGNPFLIQAHSAAITDMAWNPFHEWVLATAGSDGTAKVWKLPEAGLTSDINEDFRTLSGHGKRVDTLAWHPTTVNILATGGTDNTVRVWDITESAQEKFKVSHFTDNVDSVSWNYDGSLLAAVSRDKHLRVFDPRTTEVTADAESHGGAGKPQRVTWLGQHKLFTTGFNKTRDRELAFWDSRSMAKPLKTQSFDSSPGVLVPFFDNDTSLLFLAARGDSTIRVLEVVDEAPFYHELPPVFDKLQQKGVCMLPKRACHVMGAEVVRLLRAVNNTIIPIGFRVPRKHYQDFWEELFPDTPGGDPAQFADDYCAGKNVQPKTVSLRPTEDNSQSISSSQNSSLSSSNNDTPQGGLGTPSPSLNTSSNLTSSSSSSVAERRGSSPAPRNIFDKQNQEEVVEYYTPKEVKVVRSSKYRHILGKPFMKKDQYEGMKVLSEAMQNRAIIGNRDWMAVSWQGIGGRLAIFNVAKDKGKAPVDMSVIETGSAVMDMAFNPFKSNQLVTGGENAIIKLWNIPDGGIRQLKSSYTESVAQLKGHNHKIVTTDFHPLAENLLLSTSGDLTAKLWDITAEKESLTLKGFEDLAISSSWNFHGNALATTSKDRILRLWDPRQETCTASGPDIGGMLGTKVAWMGQKDQLALVGFDKNSERTIQIVDIKKIGQPLATLRLDNSSSVLTPLYDPDTGVLMLWGKGDTSIKFFELNDQAPCIHALTDYPSTTPQVGVALLHKTACNVKEVEIAIIYKLTQSVIEPITFSVPRTKKDVFQDDIYTPTLSAKPNNNAAGWLSGKDVEPDLISLQPAGMGKLSDIPKVVVERKRVVVQDDSFMDVEKVKERLLGSLGALANQEDAPIPGDDREGVDESEWDD